jgi:alkylation response protein AidB-like acyl-CoA dehydrogenase
MDFNLTRTQNEWQARAQQVVARLSPDATAAQVVAAAAQAQLLDAEEDLLAAAVAVEAFASQSPAAAVVLALHTCVLRSLGDHPAIDSLAKGEKVGALALSADQHPAGGARLSGRASWVAPLTDSGVAIVGGSSDGNLVAYAVRLDASTVAIERVDAAALPGVSWGHLTFNASPAIALGPTMPVMARARILLAAAGLGMGRRALREALQVARGSNKLGAGGEQTVQGLLADAATELDAAMLLTWKAASARELSLGDASLAKLMATEATQRAVTRATQVVGVDSFTAGHIVDRLARDVRLLELFAGRTEALREAAAEEVLRVD